MNIQDVLNKAQKEADEDAASKGSGGFINNVSLPVGEHKIRVFLDPDGDMFHKWKTKWAGKGHQADPRQFKECPEALASRITNALSEGHELPKPNEFFKNDFWENIYAYIYVASTTVKDNKYFKPGKVYCVSMPYYVRDALLAAITKAYSKPQFKEEMEASLDITKAGIVIEIEVKKDKKVLAFADVGAEEENYIPAPDLSEYKEGQFRPLTKFYEYKEDVGLQFADEIENGLEAMKKKLIDEDEAQVPPEESETETESKDEPKEESKSETESADPFAAKK